MAKDPESYREFRRNYYHRRRNGDVDMRTWALYVQRASRALSISRGYAPIAATVDEIVAVRVRAGGFCECCGKHTELSVDHDHATGQLRGMLCRTCNTGLGHYERRRATFESYLGRFVK